MVKELNMIMQKAAIYIRVSTDRQAEEGFSLEAQQDILMNVLEKKNLQLYRVYSDPGVSGGSFKRPGIQAMLTDMKAGKFDTILVHKLDRLSRNLGDLYGFIDQINKLNIRLIIAAQGSEEIDTRSPMGRAFLMISGIWAEIYLENLREETLKGLVKKMENGGQHISVPPLGYMHDANFDLIIVEEEAKLIRTVFQKYLQGQGVTSIARHMNTYSTGKEGGKWDTKRVRTILSNYTYAGYNHFKPDHWPEENRIITDGTHEAIINRVDFAKVRQFILRRSNGQMSKRSFDYPYSGIVRCSQCGANYVGNSSVQKGKTYKSYRCYNYYVYRTCTSPSISEKALNQLVFERIILEDDTIQPKKMEKKEKRDIQKEVEISNKRRRNWMMALGDGNLAPHDYAMMIDEEDKRMADVYAKIREDETMYEPELSQEELKQMILHIRQNWDLFDAYVQKQVIQSMFRKVEIKKVDEKWELVDMLTV